MGLDFFKPRCELVEKYKRPGQAIAYTIQTNGTKLDDEWAAFFKEHNFLVGLSVDGPQPMHDAYRVNKGGAGTFHQVMRGWQVLQKHAVDVNILCTVHAANADHPLEVYHFFRDELKAQYIQFIPIVERATEETLPLANQGWSERPGRGRPLYTQIGDLVTERTVKPEQFGRFLIAIFDEWVRHDVGNDVRRLFRGCRGELVGRRRTHVHLPAHLWKTPSPWNTTATSTPAITFVEPAYQFGNIHETHMIELVGSDQKSSIRPG